jgi:oxygen-dependent protoporphyrinogen oxidase
MSKKIVVLGSGISGLSTAYWLFKDGCDVIVLEKNPDVGGKMETINTGEFIFDKGPNSGLETTPLIRKIIDEIGLINEFLYADTIGNKRYILRDDKLHPLPMNPPAFIKTKLFSTRSKLRLFAEPFIGRSKDGYYQSVAQFVKRRLGKEFLDYAINPFVAGVFAGNPEALSVASAFPKLYALEEKYGGLIVGTLRSIRERKKSQEVSKQSAKMFSFKYGMQTFPKAIANILGKRVINSAEVCNIQKDKNKYILSVKINQLDDIIVCDKVISTFPAYVLSRLISSIDPMIAYHLDSIEYPPVLVLYVGFNKSDIGQPLDGFGFLIPEKENKKFLGAIWSSVLFPNRSPADVATFTIFVGGTRNSDLVKGDEEKLIEQVLKEFMEIMKINSIPVHFAKRYWHKAIPQYNIGYIEHEKYFEEFENMNPGFFLSGNYRGGISVGDCIKNSEVVYKKVIKSMKN